MKFQRNILSELKYYVYLYAHPETDEIFYVGKGKGNRVFSHLDDSSESEKVKVLTELSKQGLKPKIEILVHGLEDDKTALRVEASVIDLIGINNLTNVQSGYKSSTFGRMSIEQLISTYNRKKIDVVEPAVLIRINQAFRYSMTEMELYDYTRGQWKVSLKSAIKARYGFAIYEGIVQEVYEILDWFEAGKTFSTRRDSKNIAREKDEKLKGRFEFIGNLAPDKIREKYRFKSVEHYFKKGNSNPIMYVNCS